MTKSCRKQKMENVGERVQTFAQHFLLFPGKSRWIFSGKIEGKKEVAEIVYKEKKNNGILLRQLENTNLDIIIFFEFSRKMNRKGRY